MKPHRPLLLLLLLASPAFANAGPLAALAGLDAAMGCVSVGEDFVRQLQVARAPAAEVTLRPFVSLAELAPPPAREAWAMSIGPSLAERTWVLDGVVSNAQSEWFDRHTPVLSPTGMPQSLRAYPSSWDAPQR